MDPGLRQRQGLGVTNAEGVPIGQGRPLGPSLGVHPQHPSHGPQGLRGPQGPYGPSQQPFGPGQPRHNNAMPPPYGASHNEKHWYDRIVDVIVGDEGPETKYALICAQCFAHNGLALPHEIEDIRKSEQHVCRALCHVPFALYWDFTQPEADDSNGCFIRFFRVCLSQVQLFQSLKEKSAPL